MPKLSALQLNALIVLALAVSTSFALAFWIYAIWDFGQGAQTYQGHVVGYKCSIISCEVQVRFSEESTQVSVAVSGARRARILYQERATVPLLYNSIKQETVIDTYQQRWSRATLYFGLSIVFLIVWIMGCIQLFQRSE